MSACVYLRIYTHYLPARQPAARTSQPTNATNQPTAVGDHPASQSAKRGAQAEGAGDMSLPKSIYSSAAAPAARAPTAAASQSAHEKCERTRAPPEPESPSSQPTSKPASQGPGATGRPPNAQPSPLSLAGAGLAERHMGIKRAVRWLPANHFHEPMGPIGM
eukprot:6912890-Pyramimonas_sp.AAC.1